MILFLSNFAQKCLFWLVSVLCGGARTICTTTIAEGLILLYLVPDSFHKFPWTLFNTISFIISQLLSVTVRVIQRDAEEKRASFNSRPYFRLFIDWIFDLLAPDPILDNAHFQVWTLFDSFCPYWDCVN